MIMMFLYIQIIFDMWNLSYRIINMKYYYSWLIILALAFIQCDITLIKTNSPIIANSTASAFSFDTLYASQFSIFITGSNTTQHTTHQISVNSNNFSQIVSTTVMPSNITYPVRQRGAMGNKLGIQSTFLIFTTLRVVKYEQNFTVSTLIAVTINQNTLIQQSLFVGNSTTNIIILVSKFNTNYNLLYLSNSTQVASISTAMPPTATYLNKYKQTSQHVYFIFNTGIFIFSTNTSLTYITNIPFPSGLPANTTFSFDVDDVVGATVLVYGYANRVFVLDIANVEAGMPAIGQLEVGSTVDDVAISLPYLYVAIGSQILQYDVDVSAVVASYAVQTTSCRFSLLQQSVLVAHTQYNTTYARYSIFRVNSMYSIGSNTSCRAGYVYDGTAMCVKNLNSSNGYQNGSTDQQKFYLEEILGKCLSFSSINIMPKFIKYLSILLDDLWYYKFHRTNYPISATTFMNKIDIINQFKLDPGFIQQYSVIEVEPAQKNRYNALL